MLCSELASAVARWRPAVISGARGKAMEAPARGVEERRQLWRNAWEGHVKLEVAGWPRAAGGMVQRR